VYFHINPSIFIREFGEGREEAFSYFLTIKDIPDPSGVLLSAVS
jgi:hypothetical protein